VILSDAADRVVAIKLVMDRVQPEAAPTLTTGQIELEVDRAKIASTWQPNTLYKRDAVVVPDTRIGHSFRCIQSGTSGSVWVSPVLALVQSSGFQFSDGNSDPVLVWEEIGTDRFNGGIDGAEFNVYDIGRASQQCWAIKERLASQFISEGDVSFQELYEHCREQVGRFRPFRRPIRLVRC